MENEKKEGQQPFEDYDAGAFKSISLGARSADASLNFRSLNLEGSFGGRQGISSFDQEVTRSIGAVASRPAHDLGASNYWGVSATHDHMSDLSGLDMPSFQKPSFNKQTNKHNKEKNFDPSFDNLSFQATAFQGSAAPVPVLLDVPVYVEKYTSFYSATAPKDVLLAICSCLAATEVDHEFQAMKFKIKGMKYAASGRVTFHVRCYKTAVANECLVEFQRRAGSCTDFSAFYRGLLDGALKKHVSRPFLKDLPKNSAAMCPVEEDNVVLNQETVRSLCEMIMSNHVETQRESIQALASLSKSQTNQLKLLEFSKSANTCAIPCLKKVLDNVLTSPDETTVRYGALLLAHLSTHTEARAELVREVSLVTAMLSLLDAPGALTNRDTKRQVSCALASISTCPKASRTIMDHSDCPTMEVLKKYRDCQDDVVRKNVCAAMDGFNHVC